MNGVSPVRQGWQCTRLRSSWDIWTPYSWKKPEFAPGTKPLHVLAPKALRATGPSTPHSRDTLSSCNMANSEEKLYAQTQRW